MSSKAVITRGNTGPIWHISVPDINEDGDLTGAYADLSDYTCSLEVNGVLQIINSKNTTNTAFLAQLYSSTTAQLEPGSYRVAIEVRNDKVAPPFVSELFRTITIKADMV